MTLACEGLGIRGDLTANGLLSLVLLKARGRGPCLSATERVLTGLCISRALCLKCSPLSFAWKLAPSHTSNLSVNPILSEWPFLP